MGKLPKSTAKTQAWQLWPDAEPDDDEMTYYCDGWEPFDGDQLTKVLIADGAADSRYDAEELVKSASVAQGWYGYVDGDSDPSFCNALKMTLCDDDVDEAFPMTFAVVKRRAWRQ
jgi:hypothetical protein